MGFMQSWSTLGFGVFKVAYFEKRLVCFYQNDDRFYLHFDLFVIKSLLNSFNSEYESIGYEMVSCPPFTFKMEVLSL